MRRLNWKIIGKYNGQPHDLQLMTNDPDGLIRKLKSDPSYNHIEKLEAVFVGDVRHIASSTGLRPPRGK